MDSLKNCFVVSADGLTEKNISSSIKNLITEERAIIFVIFCFLCFIGSMVVAMVIGMEKQNTENRKIEDLTIQEFGDILYYGKQAENSQVDVIKISNMEALLSAPKKQFEEGNNSGSTDCGNKTYPYIQQHCFEMLFPFYGTYTVLKKGKNGEDEGIVAEHFINELLFFNQQVECDYNTDELVEPIEEMLRRTAIKFTLCDKEEYRSAVKKKLTFEEQTEDERKKKLTEFAKEWIKWLNDFVDNESITLSTKLSRVYEAIVRVPDLDIPAVKNMRDHIKKMISMSVTFTFGVTAYLCMLVKQGVSQIVLTGAPGTGKTRAAKEVAEYMGKELSWKGAEDSHLYYQFVQFHPSYDYTDFVEGLRPVEVGGQGVFKKTDGIFKEFCRKVAEGNKNNEENDKEKYFFIIDEINRADLSKVFGELMYCLEQDKRGQENRVQTQYQNLPTFDVENLKQMEKTKMFLRTGFIFPKMLSS